MSEWNPLETQLRSWTPRRPSAELDAIFAPALRRAPVRPRALPWVAPALAGFLFMCLIINQQNAGLVGSQGASPMVGVSLSNQSYVAYIPNSYQPANNRLDTFEWTNGAGSVSPVHFLSPQRAQD